MTADIRGDLEPGVSDDIVALAERLRDSRPRPSPAFRGELGRRLSGRPRSRLSRARARVLVGAYSAAGVLLLAVGAIGAAGHGGVG
jgi:hypothetical protein